jgi:hypothetical protein
VSGRAGRAPGARRGDVVIRRGRGRKGHLWRHPPAPRAELRAQESGGNAFCMNDDDNINVQNEDVLCKEIYKMMILLIICDVIVNVPRSFCDLCVANVLLMCC